jgi:hypothetical protein
VAFRRQRRHLLGPILQNSVSGRKVFVLIFTF